jgi:hypothetical protein
MDITHVRVVGSDGLRVQRDVLEALKQFDHIGI